MTGWQALRRHAFLACPVGIRAAFGASANHPAVAVSREDVGELHAAGLHAFGRDIDVGTGLVALKGNRSYFDLHRVEVQAGFGLARFQIFSDALFHGVRILNVP